MVIPSSYIENSTSDYVNYDNEIYTCPLSDDSITNSTVHPDTGKYVCITALGMTSILFSDSDSVTDQKTINETSTNNDNIPSPSVMNWAFVDRLVAATIEDDFYLNQFVLSNSILSVPKVRCGTVKGYSCCIIGTSDKFIDGFRKNCVTRQHRKYDVHE